MTLKERIDFAKRMQHDIIMVKDGNYVSGKWDELAYAKEQGFKLVGIVARLWRETHK